MTATLQSERLTLAGALAAHSALSRRRAHALYQIAAYDVKLKWVAVAAAVLVVLAATAAATRPAGTLPPPRSRAQSLVLPTAASQFDRLFIPHRVQHGDTIWGLAQHYYGASSEAYQRKLLDANPGLPKDLRLLTVDTAIKVPLL